MCESGTACAALPVVSLVTQVLWQGLLLDLMEITRLMEGEHQVKCIPIAYFSFIRITPVKPPGGESHLVVGNIETNEQESDEERSSSRY